MVREIESLATPTNGPHISLYMPTVRAGKETRQNPTRFKNLLKRAREQFAADEVDARDVEELLAPVEDYGADPEVWKKQLEGLAIFSSRDVFRVVQVPYEVNELVATGPRFHLKPILPLMLSGTDYYMLTLGLGGCRLYRGTRYAIEEVEVPELPQGMEEALRYDDVDTPQKTGQRMPGRHGAQNTGMHAHATAEDKLNRDIDRYIRRVERTVSEYLGGAREPLFIAGTDYLLPVYREHNRYAGLLDEEIAMNPNSLDPESLRQAAWERLAPIHRRRQAEARERFNSMHGRGRTSDRIEEVVSASLSGRVETLFVNPTAEVWGTVSPGDFEAEVHGTRQPGDIDVVDAAAVEALMRGAEIFLGPEETPLAESPAAATFRY
jgi:hypothetical protein